MICQGHFIYHQKHGYSRKKQEPEARDRVRRQIEKRSEEIAKMIHPHDDEPDPTAYMKTITSHKCCLPFVLGFVLCLSWQWMR